MALHGMCCADFMAAWKASLERTARSRKEPRTRAIVSGAFASLCLQRIGLLPDSPTSFYLPMNFADRPGEERTCARSREGANCDA